MSANNSTPGLAAESRTNPVLLRMVDLEMSRLVENWRFEGDAVHILLALPARGCVCGVDRWWFVNRDGRTRCWQCDAEYLKDRDAMILTQAAVNA